MSEENDARDRDFEKAIERLDLAASELSSAAAHIMVLSGCEMSVALRITCDAVLYNAPIEPGYCKKCNRPFLKLRVDQTFCSKFCRQSLYNKKFRDKKKNESNKLRST